MAIEDGGARAIARRSRGTPRVANRLLKRVRDYAEVRGDGVVTARRRRRPRSTCWRSTTKASTGSTARSCGRSASKFGGGPGRALDPRGRGRRGAGHDRGRLRALSAAARADRAHAARPGRDPARVRAPGARAARARRRSSDAEPALARTALAAAANSPRYAALSILLPMSHEHYFICPHCGHRLDGHRAQRAAFAREARDARSAASRTCSSCSTTTTRHPNAAFFACDGDGRIVDCGRGSFELTGLKTEKAIGRRVGEVLGLRFETAPTTSERRSSGKCGPGQAGRGQRRWRPSGPRRGGHFPAYDDDEGGCCSC